MLWVPEGCMELSCKKSCISSLEECQILVWMLYCCLLTVKCSTILISVLELKLQISLTTGMRDLWAGQAQLENIQGQKLPYGTPNHAWLSLDLLEILCCLAEMGHFGSVRALLDLPLKHCPELLVLGLAQIKVLILFHLSIFSVRLLVLALISGFETRVICSVLVDKQIQGNTTMRGWSTILLIRGMDSWRQYVL